MPRKKEEIRALTQKKEELSNNCVIVTDDAKILKQLAEQSLILVTQFDAIEKKLDKTIEILNKILLFKIAEHGG